MLIFRWGRGVGVPLGVQIHAQLILLRSLTWNWTIWRQNQGDWSLKIDFEECSLKIEGWRTKFEDWIWKKASFFWVGRGAYVGDLHLEVNSGASVDVGRIFFHGALQALESHQLSIWEKGETFYDMGKQYSETTTLLAGVRCCVTTTLSA